MNTHTRHFLSSRPLGLFLWLALPLCAHARQTLGPALPLPGDTLMGAAAGDQEKVDVAQGTNGYLAVWQDRRSSLTGTVASDGTVRPNFDIFAALLDAQGQPLPGGSVIIDQSPFSQLDPVVAFNGQDYLVVWQSTRLSGFWKTDGILAARVSASGALLDDPPIVIEDSDDQDEHYPLVASDGSNWMVLWTDYEGGATDIVKGAIVDPAGQVLLKQTVVQPASNSLVPRNYDLAFAVDRYLFVYEQGWGGYASAHPIGTNLVPLGPGVHVSSGTGFRPGVAASPSGFFVSWTASSVQNTSHVRGTPVSLSGSPLIANGIALSLGAPVWTSAASSTVAWDGSEWTAAWESFDFTNGQTLHAAQISSAGALQAGSPFDVVPSGSFCQLPALAGGNGQALLLWGDGRNSAPSTLERDIFGTLLSPGAQQGVQAPAAVAPGSQTHPRLAGDRASGYLLVFRSEHGGERRVMAQRLDGLGQPIDAQPRLVASGSILIGTHDVAWNGSEWMVVFEQRLDTGSLLTARVLARRMLPDGSWLDASPLDLMPGNDPAVDALGQDFLVVSSEEPVNHARYIRARRVAADGSLLGSQLTLSSSYAQAPAVVGLHDRWFVAWHRRPTHDSPFASVQGSWVLAGGGNGAPIALEAAPGGKSVNPALCMGDDGAMLAWNDTLDVRVRALDLLGNPLGAAAGNLLCDAPSAQFAPSLGWTGDAYFGAFDDHRLQSGIEPGLGDVYAGRATRDGMPLDLGSALAIGADSAAVEGNPEVEGGGGQLVSAHAAVLGDGHFATHRILLRRFDDAALGDAFCLGDSWASCPCANEGDSGGCVNSTGAGASLSATASASVLADDLLLHGVALPALQPALLFQGTTALGGGAGLPFGDGLRCVGGALRRLGVRSVSVAGLANFGPGLALAGAWQAGETQNFQLWYRDPSGGPCGSGFNLSNALRVTLEP